MNNSKDRIIENFIEIENAIKKQRALVYATYLLGVTENMIEQMAEILSPEEYEELERECSELYGALVDIINTKMFL